MAYNQYILICGGTGCESSKADDIYCNILDELDKVGARADVQVVKTGCFGFCEKGPIVKVLPDEAKLLSNTTRLLTNALVKMVFFVLAILKRLLTRISTLKRL